MISLMRNRILAVLVTFHMVLSVASPAVAQIIPSLGSPTQTAGQTVLKDTDSIQLELENKIVQEKLKAYGFTSEEVASKLSSMNPRQIHVLAVSSSDVLAGGDAGTVVLVFVIIATVIALYALSGSIFGAAQK